MAILKVEGVTHWSIPVNDLAEAEDRFTGSCWASRRLDGWETT